MAGMVGEPPPVLFWVDKEDLAMKAYARSDEILNVGYFLNGLLILDMKFANSVLLWHHLYGRHDW